MDVYLARKRNVNGGASGLVTYSKVKDVEKLLKALNNVWFGDWKVVAKVASFDRFGKNQAEGGKRDEGEKIHEGEKSKLEGVKNYEGDQNALVVRDEVVDVEVGEDELLGYVPKKNSNVAVISKQQYVLIYRYNIQDVTWATNGLMVMALN